MSPPRQQHPWFEDLADLVDGRLSEVAGGEVTTHLAVCADCAASIEWLQRTLGIMRTTQLDEPPEHVVRRAVRALRHHRPIVEVKPGLVQIVATLLFDSWQQAGGLAFGLRTAQVTPRQLLFTAGEREIEMRMQRAPDGWVLSGQVLGECREGSVVELVGPRTQSAPLNEVCEFALRGLEPGSYTLTLRLDSEQIVVSGLSIGV